MLANLRRDNGLQSNVQAVGNQHKILTAMSRFGWLSVKQVWQFCWPNDMTSRSALRTLAALRQRKEVIFKKRDNGSRIYTLTALGILRVNEELGLPADLDAEFAKRTEMQFEHRSLANQTCVWWEREQNPDGAAYYTEHEIVQGRAPLREFQGDGFSKIPDALLAMNSPNDDGTYLGWVEVERGYKKDADQSRMAETLCRLLPRKDKCLPAGDNAVVRFAVVVCPTESHKVRLCDFILEHLKKNKWRYDVPFILANVCILDPAEGELVPLWRWMGGKPEWLTKCEECGVPLPTPAEAE